MKVLNIVMQLNNLLQVKEPNEYGITKTKLLGQSVAQYIIELACSVGNIGFALFLCFKW